MDIRIKKILTESNVRQWSRLPWEVVVLPLLELLKGHADKTLGDMV